MLSTTAFVRQAFELWYPGKKIVPVPLFRDPVRLNWEQEASSYHPEAVGEFTQNPATQGLDFAKMFPERFEVLELPGFVGQPLWKVGAHLRQTYGRSHLIPGVELWRFFSRNSRRAIEILRPPQGVWRSYFFFGSLFRNSDGLWYVPWAGWNCGKWSRNGRWLGGGWVADTRVVLVKK